MEYMWNFNGIKNWRWRPGTGSKYEIMYVSAFTHDSNKIPTAIPMFSMSSNTTDWSKHCRLSGWVRNQRWRPGTGSAYEIMCSAAMQDDNTIPTAILMFLRSSNMTALIVRILSYVRVSGISKMAACNRNWINSTYFPQNLTWKSIRISPVMMLDAKNISIFLGIVLPSCIQTEIHVI